MRIALYLRLSVPDGDLGRDNKDESNSIENQRELLMSYLTRRGDLYSPGADEVTEFVDDGYSGTNFERPSFKRMIWDAKRGKIDIILIKDFSRLGRDYIAVGDYMEQVFPLLGVRLISVNNGYDSKNGPASSLEVELTNLVNTLYSRDLSRKVRSGNLVRYRNGTKVQTRLPYGYRKSGVEWIVEPEAAGVVRMIFEEAIGGRSAASIAAMLNERKILTRAEYQRAHGMDIYGTPVTAEHERLWTSAMVCSVLGTYSYTGAMVGAKLEAVAVGSHRSRRRPEEEWVVLEGNHEAIVSREEFEKAQAALAVRRRTGYIIPRSYPLKGKVRCGNCRRALAHAANTYEEYFYCQHGRQQGKFSKCSKEHYPVREVEHAVLKSLESLAGRIAGLRDRQEVNVSSGNLMKRIERLRDRKLRLYEQYAEGTMGKEEYLGRKSELQGEIETLETRLKDLRAEEEARRELEDAVDAALEGIDGFEKLTAEMEERFIEAVYIHGRGEIEVVYKLEEVIRKALGM